MDSVAGCEEQVAKILAYEDGPLASGHYEEIELVASFDNVRPAGVNEFNQALDAVAAQSYAGYAPIFTRRYGSNPDGCVAYVIDDINGGRGIVVYDGHGTSSSWGGWDCNGASLTTWDVQGLVNTSKTPVVLALACQNNRMDDVGDCIGEEWMERELAGAVGHFGSVRNSYRCHNHLFASSFFRCLYRDDAPIIADVIQAAQFDAMGYNNYESHSDHTIWQNQWLGDPSMKVWREDPPHIFLEGLPAVVGLGAQLVSLRVIDAQGQPVPGAIVALHKPGEVLTNAYSDASGRVDLPVDLLTPGNMTARAHTDFGRARGERGVIAVGGGSGVADAADPGRAFSLEAVPTVTAGPLELRIGGGRAGDGAEVTIYAVTGQLVRRLAADVGPARISAGAVRRIGWDGRDGRGEAAPSGVYVAVLRAGGAMSARERFVLVR